MRVHVHTCIMLMCVHVCVTKYVQCDWDLAGWLQSLCPRSHNDSASCRLPLSREELGPEEPGTPPGHSQEEAKRGFPLSGLRLVEAASGGLGAALLASD